MYPYFFDYDSEKLIDILAVVGPTATGKTRLAIELAKFFDGEVISADSAQIYKNMKIGTAKPSEEELGKIRYHLIDFLEPKDAEFFSVAEYVRLAKQKIFSIRGKKRYPIVCGGTGLYVDSLVENVNFFENAKDSVLRNKLQLICKRRGSDVLYKELEKIDPETAKKIHKNNVVRIIRALEFYVTSGFRIAKQVELSKLKKIFNPTYVGLNYKNRENLVKSINKRVDCMVKDGLLQEALENFKDESNKVINKIIGYKELIEYFEGKSTLDEAIERIKIHTRQYAKRQMTWFKRNEKIKWFYIDEEGDFDSLFNNVKDYVKSEREKTASLDVSKN